MSKQVYLGNQEYKLERDTMIVSETDAKGIILYANEDFCTLAGYTKEELIGKPHNYVRNKFMPRAAFKDLWTTVQAGKIWNGIVVNSTASGGYYWVNATVYPTTDRNGKLRYVSVRKKPTSKEIEDAIALYVTLD